MIEIHINKNVGKPGYWMSLINPDSMRDVLYLRFDCRDCVNAFLMTLEYAQTDELDITNWLGKDWENDTKNCKRKIP
jgi:hypothetical protein